MEWFKFLKWLDRSMYGRPASIVESGEMDVEFKPDWEPGPETPLGIRALNLARLEVGNGELGKNNAGPHVERYRAGDGTGLPKGGSGSWCAAFCAYCYTEANGGKAPFETSRGAKRLVRNMAKAGRQLDEPEEGCLIAWHRGLRDKQGRWTWRGHVEIAETVNHHNGKIVTIGGNRGKYPSKVCRYTYSEEEWRRKLYRMAAFD